ncbi:MAG TPA: hypothetical protein PLT65_00425, partial [Bacilli bacterium]|nr:hypothetical protein [Bacilli bacterium]
MIFNFLNINIQHVFLNWASGIYAFAGDVYQFIIDLATQEYMDSKYIEAFTENIMVFVGVITLFRLAITLIQYLVDPDSAGDKKTGSGKLIVGVILMLAMLLTFNKGFQLLRDFQQAVIEDNILTEIFTVQTVNEAEQISVGFTCTYGPLESTGIFYNRRVTPTITFLANQDGTKVVGLTDWSIDTAKYTNIANNENVDLGGVAVYFYATTNDTLNSCPKYIYAGEFEEFSSDGFKTLNTWMTLTPFWASYRGMAAIASEKVLFTDQLIEGVTIPHAQLVTSESVSYENDAGRTMAGLMFFSFVKCSQSLITDSKGANDCTKFQEYKEKNNMTSLTNIMDDDFGKDDDYHLGITGSGILALIFGIVFLLFLVVTTVDVAVRSMKLLFLQLLAPFPIICFAIPKAKETFNGWIKTIGSVYFDLFLRIILISIANFVASKLKIDSGRPLIDIMMVLGLLLFLKEAPQFICNMFGIKDTGSMKGFTLNPFQKLREIPVVGGAMGMAGRAAGTVLGNAATRSKNAAGLREAKDNARTASAASGGSKKAQNKAARTAAKKFNSANSNPTFTDGMFKAGRQGWQENGGLMGVKTGDTQHHAKGVLEARSETIKGNKEKALKVEEHSAIVNTSNQTSRISSAVYNDATNSNRPTMRTGNDAGHPT